MSKPHFTQHALGTPFISSSFNVSNTQDAIDDSLWFHRNYLPVRDRDYFIPDGYQYKVYDCAIIDHNLIIDGMGVIFG